MKNKIWVVVIVIGMLVMNFSETYACWAYLSVDDLFDQSDIIVIGEVGKSVQNNKSDELNRRVKVYYYLKGELKEDEMVVATPGENVSTHYTLGKTGSKVLLFLNEREGIIRPLSPQGVIKISLADDSSIVNSGSDLLKIMNVQYDQMGGEVKDKEKEALTKRISEFENIRSVEPSHSPQDHDSILLKKGIYILVVLVMAMSIVTWIKKKT